jgi:hypothetical protein
MEKQPGIDLATAPRTVTLSGRQARVALEEHEHITDPPFSPRKLFNRFGRLTAE